MENEELESGREFAMKSNEPIVHQMINNNIKQNYIVESTLSAIRRVNIENMQNNIKLILAEEKNALSHGDQTEDNA